MAAGDRNSRLFLKSFKKLSVDKEIPQLLNSNGGLANSWEEVANISTSFFEDILGHSQSAHSLPTEAEFNEVLEAQPDCLIAAEKTELNAPITMEELGEAVAELANNKCPGLDGTPNEFYKANWTVVGPLVLRCVLR